MAKIRVQAFATFEGVKYLELHYSAKGRIFHIKLSPDLTLFAQTVGKREPYVSGKTEDECIANMKTFLVEFSSGKIEETKVIGYNFDWISKNIDDRSGDTPRGYNRSDEVRLAFDFKVLSKKSIGKNYRYSYVDDNGKSCELSRYDVCNYEFIDWTQEREDFMKDFYDSMEKLIRMLKKFVDTPEALLYTVNSKIKLLSSPRGEV